MVSTPASCCGSSGAPVPGCGCCGAREARVGGASASWAGWVMAGSQAWVGARRGNRSES